MPVDLEQVREAVEAVLRTGVRPAKLLDLPAVVGLAAAGSIASEVATAVDLAFAAEALFKRALVRLGDGPFGQAARLLFGVDNESRGLPLKTRRRLAAEELGVYPSTFRRLYEDSILLDVAYEVLRLIVDPA
ncbi:MAG TPA: hypothetical protein VKA15_04680 [Isosphaeraceae bacterium]|nr:hypothetical protein [Isosphaeraceae bacterium]